MTKHSFIDLGEQLIASLKKAADDNVAEAKNLQDSVNTLSEGITAQVNEYSKLLSDMEKRLHTFGEGVLTAHKKFLNGQAHENPSP
jgi:hypothetical protein